MITTLKEKEVALQEQFKNEQKEASIIEEQIKSLQIKYQERAANMTRIQGAFSLIQDLKKEEETKEEPKTIDTEKK